MILISMRSKADQIVHDFCGAGEDGLIPCIYLLLAPKESQNFPDRRNSVGISLRLCGHRKGLSVIGPEACGLAVVWIVSAEIESWKHFKGLTTSIGMLSDDRRLWISSLNGAEGATEILPNQKTYSWNWLITTGISRL